MFFMFQNELTSLSSLKAIKTDINVRYSRIALNRKYFKTRAKSLK